MRRSTHENCPLGGRCMEFWTLRPDDVLKCPEKQKPNTISEGESWTLTMVVKDNETMACRAEKPCYIRYKTRAGVRMGEARGRTQLTEKKKKRDVQTEAKLWRCREYRIHDASLQARPRWLVPIPNQVPPWRLFPIGWRKAQVFMYHHLHQSTYSNSTGQPDAPTIFLITGLCALTHLRSIAWDTKELLRCDCFSYSFSHLFVAR